jgi:hypothetical protein
MDRDLGKIVKGQEVWVKVIDGSNVARFYYKSSNIEDRILQGEVTKVGRKYITVKFGRYKEEQFNIEDEYRNKYTAGGADYQLYLTKQDILDEVEVETIHSEIRSAFGDYRNNGKFTLEQLRRIRDIINEGND